jgi:hypothetical protein
MIAPSLENGNEHSSEMVEKTASSMVNRKEFRRCPCKESCDKALAWMGLGLGLCGKDWVRVRVMIRVRVMRQGLG